MNQKETTWDFEKFMLPIAAMIGVCGLLYGMYYGVSYWKKRNLQNSNEILHQVLAEYEKASQGYPGGWETLREVSRIAVDEQKGSPLEAYFVAFHALATSQLASGDAITRGYARSRELVNSQLMQDLLSIDYALASLDEAAAGSIEHAPAIAELEQFYARLGDNSNKSEHFFDEYASYMLAYYYYAQNDLERATRIWEAIAKHGERLQATSHWQELSKKFVE